MQRGIKNLWSLPVLILLLAAAAGVVLAQDKPEKEKESGPKYEGVKVCKLCHMKRSIGSQYKAWTKQKHAKAFETLKSEEAKKVAEKAGVTEAPDKAPQCLKCHVTAYGLPKDRYGEGYSMEEGVECEQCHGPGQHFAEPENGKHAAEGQIHPTVEVCKKCHNPENPTWNPEEYTLENGNKVGFDFKLAFEKIAHPIPKEGEESEDKGE
jgi:hypothetical protein